jgi:formylglycine-generating enzyme
MRRGLVVTVVVVCTWGSVGVGCSLISTDGFSSGNVALLEGGRADAPDVPRDGAAAPPSDAAPSDETGSKSCPKGRGPEMLNLGAFCIDTTEVTQAQYKAFLDEKGSDPNGQPQRCSSWNASYQPLGSCNFNPSARANYPVAGVDWCDAFAFCAWAGKRMCGKIGGGKLPGGGVNPSAGKDPMQSQWAYACTKGGDGQHKYAYGNTYNASACTTPGSGRSQPTEVGSQSQCVGGFPGLFDMIGNVSEWEDNCDDDNAINPAKDRCYHRGGNIAFGPYDCFELEVDERSHVDPDCEWGIRCCADL